MDILLARGLIDEETHHAAAWFSGLARIVVGRAWPVRDSLDEAKSASVPSDAAIRWGQIGYAFIVETLDAKDREQLLELVHFQLMPRWLIKQINNGVAMRSGDVAARARSLEALRRLAFVHQQWRGAKLPVAAE